MSHLPDLESPDFAPALKALRKQLRLSRTALAEMVGLSTAAIQRYEALDSSNIKPSRDAYERLSDVVARLLAEGESPVAIPLAEPPLQTVSEPVAESAAVLRDFPAGILLADATLEQLIARAKLLGARKVTIEF